MMMKKEEEKNGILVGGCKQMFPNSTSASFIHSSAEECSVASCTIVRQRSKVCVESNVSSKKQTYRNYDSNSRRRRRGRRGRRKRGRRIRRRGRRRRRRRRRRERRRRRRKEKKEC